MKLSKSAIREFQRYGRQGGRTRAQNLTPDRRRAVARLASIRRWTRVRFGEAQFVDLNLPGAKLIDDGLADLAEERESAAAFAVSLAAPRLRREGVPLPTTLPADGEPRLYRLLEKKHGDLAHARYLAILREVQSFADACRMFHETRRTSSNPGGTIEARSNNP